MSTLARELRLARLEIREGRFQRTMALVTAFAAVVSGFEAYTQHLRGAFNHWLMWTPVWLTPPAVLASLAAIGSKRAARRLLPMLSLVSLLDGLVGFVFHVRGIRRMPGGFSLGQYNVVMGPPVFAPLLMSSVGVVGLIAGLLRRERVDDAHSPGELAGSLLLVADDLLRPPGTSRRIARDIGHGQFQKRLALVSAFFAVLAGGEAYFEHLRGSFNQRVMWTPVLVTPPMVVAGVGAAMSPAVARRLLPVTSVVTFLDGLLGFWLHLGGIRRMPGGFANLQFNITMGPPLFAPLLFCSVGMLGLISSLLRRKEPAR